MIITLGTQVLTAILFGLVFAGLRILIAGSPRQWRDWLAEAVVLAGLCFIILFGAITL